MLKNFFTFSRFTLFVALCISAIAAYYSVVGLTAIFAGAVVPIIVMGTILEIAKITTTVWLHRYWDLASWSIKTYLTAAVIALACLTSMGIFGLLSKAHSDTGLVSGDVAASLSIIDEKIKTQRENIDAARKAILQLDEQVNQRLSRGSSEAGAERSVQIRRQQTGERNKLQKEISDAQTVIAKLNEERVPIAAQNRKVEAEVGPIKYIASLIYGDNPDSNLLERAVRWVTILIVIVFDPLAIILILAANNSLKWEEQRRSNETVSPELPTASTLPPSVDTQITDSVTSGLDSLPPIHDPIIEPPPEVEAQQEETIRTFDVEDDDVYSDATNDFDPTTVENSTPWPHIWQEDPVEQDQQEMISKNNTVQPEIAVEGVTREAKMYHPADGYVIFEGKNISIAALKELHPELVLSENSPKLEILFGTKFPIAARSGDIYVRIDQIPHVVYKFNGKKWIVLDKNKNTTYLQNIAYIQYMISRLDIGEYDPDYLTPAEQDEISEYLKKSP